MNKNRATSIIGILLASLGITVLLGWLLRLPALVSLVPGSVAMGINAALCFVATGWWLCISSNNGHRSRRQRALISRFLIVLPSAILIEHIFDYSLGIDLPSIHRMFQDANLRPGRVAPNTSLAFLLSGVVFSLLDRPNTSAAAAVLQRISACGILLLGLSGLLGYLLQLEWMYQWYRFNRMALPTAIGLSILGCVIWAHLMQLAQRNENQSADYAKRITSLSTSVLAGIALVSGLAAFSILQQSVEGVLTDDLMQTARDRSAFFSATINQNVQMADLVATRPAVYLYLKKLNLDPSDTATAALLDETAKSYASLGFSGIAFLGKGGKKLSAAGIFSERSELTVPLKKSKSEMSLVWDDGFVLHGTTEIVENGSRLGMVVTERRLDDFTELFAQTPGMGRSGEHKICSRNKDMLDCFPSRLVPKVFHTPFFRDGQPSYPAARAILGQSGVVKVNDFRGEKVLASYIPLGSTGLGLVVKMDTAEIFAPIRARFQYILMFLAGLSVLGAFAIRSFVKPLAAQLVASEKAALVLEERTRVIIETAYDAFVGMDAEGRVTDWNPQAELTFGWTREEVLGRELADLIIPPALREGHRNGLAHFKKTGSGPVINKRMELTALRRSGEEFPVELTINAITSGGGLRFSSFLQDITERKLAEQRLTHLAQHDALTGLPNRTLFFDRLENAILRAQRSKQAVAVFFLDLDGFKNINDTLGHQAGDFLLKGFAERLKEIVRKTDSVSRLAGDEFTIILEGLVDPYADARVVAEKIIAAMTLPFALSGEQVVISTSMGIAQYLSGPITADEMIRQADTAMYLTKQCGRNGFRFYAEQE